MQLFTSFTNAVPLGISGLVAPTEIISPEAQEVLDNMPVPLVGDERLAVIAFVNTQSVSLGSGNWALMDAFAHGKLSNNTNKLHKWIANSPMINNGATLSAAGWSFNGSTAFINTGFIPINGVNYKLNDALVSTFIVAITPGTDQASCGVFITGAARVQITDQNTNNQIQYRLNCSGASSLNGVRLTPNNLYSVIRTAATATGLFINGSSGSASAAVSGELSTGPINIGQRGDGQFFTGQISSFKAGAAIGFDHTSYFDNLVILNAAL